MPRHRLEYVGRNDPPVGVVAVGLSYFAQDPELGAVDGDSGLGLEAQEECITREAARRGWTCGVLADVGRSGKHVNPQLRRALDLLASGQADALMVSKVDRLACSVPHASDVLGLAQRQGWDLVVLDLGVELGTPQGRAMAQMLAVFAELERELISSRTREALAARKRRGEPIGRPRLAPAPVVRRIVQAREAGASYRTIAGALTADGVLSPAGRPAWQESSVRRLYAAATAATTTGAGA